MGDPKKQHKTYTTPRVPYDTEMFMEELKLLGAYGLRNKHELWRVRTELSTLRRRARGLLAQTATEREKQEKEMIGKLHKMGLVQETGTLDDILTLSIEDLMERRLQTFIFRKGMTKSLWQARQFITHGHVSIKGNEVKVPSYHVLIDDEKTIEFTNVSPFNNKDHPLRREMAVNEIAGGNKVE
ncbi:MAG: 30S ribosomal protein S4 [Candidatus Bathyarchaeota archaeon]|nr:30S ribosomal protein S4 [Candidatus Bathyarchaeota archaeon]